MNRDTENIPEHLLNNLCPRIAEYYVIQYEVGNVHDLVYYNECLQVLEKYGLRNKPFIREVINETI
jgi:hypothetical protein